MKSLRAPERRSGFSDVITSARCVTLGRTRTVRGFPKTSTPHKSAGDEKTSCRAQPSCRSLVPPSTGAGCCWREASEPCAPRRSRARDARRSKGGEARRDPQPLSPLRGRRAGPTLPARSRRRARSRSPRGGARSAIFPGSPGRAGPL